VQFRPILFRDFNTGDLRGPLLLWELLLQMIYRYAGRMWVIPNSLEINHDVTERFIRLCFIPMSSFVCFRAYTSFGNQPSGPKRAKADEVNGVSRTHPLSVTAPSSSICNLV